MQPLIAIIDVMHAGHAYRQLRDTYPSKTTRIYAQGPSRALAGGWLGWLWEWCFLRPVAGPPQEAGVDWTAQHGSGDGGFIDRHGALFEDNKGAF